MVQKVIDGSILEGGGQILRNAAALSAITCQSCEISNIRAGRAKPGLAAQHLTGLRLVNVLSQGRLVGDELRSTCVELHPQALCCGAYTADVGTAGAVTLLAQAALPCALFARPCGASQTPGDGSSPSTSGTGAGPAQHSDSRSGIAAGKGAGTSSRSAFAAPTHIRGRAPGSSVLELKGGTNADMAPPADYMQQVLVPSLRQLLHVDVSVDIVRRGFYPQGGGVMRLTVHALPPGTTLPAFQLTERGVLSAIAITAFTAGKVPAAVGHAMLDAARAELRTMMRKNQLGPAAQGATIDGTAVREGSETAFGNGAGIMLVATTTSGCLFGASAIHAKGSEPEATAAVAVAELAEGLSSGSCVDQWLQDQLIVFMALAKGTSRVLMSEPTLHTRTAMTIAEALTAARFRVFKPPAGARTASNVAAVNSDMLGSGTASGQGQGSVGQRQYGPGLWLVECTGAGWAAPAE